MGSVPFVSVKSAMPHFTAEKHWNDSDENSATTDSHMFHWDWKFPRVRRVPAAADCRCRSAAIPRTQQRPERDTPAQIYTRKRFPTAGLRETVLDEQRQKPSVSCASQRPRSCPGHTDMWVLGRRRFQTETEAPLTKARQVVLSIMSLLCQ